MFQHSYRSSRIALAVLAIPLWLISFFMLGGGAVAFALPLYVLNPLAALIAGVVVGARREAPWLLLAGVATMWLAFHFATIRDSQMLHFVAAYVACALVGWGVAFGIAQVRVRALG